MKTEAQVILLNPFAVCSLRKLKFVVCPFVDEETNGGQQFVNGLNGRNGLAYYDFMQTQTDVKVFF